ncbi:MAG: DUF2480 family protein [Cytophagales bacterium]|nr:MAG: DUF2480 family protein [Cytophagales bacterium]TAF60888.1 MAG: DUF2480 family protein [Cytophagales bacterium]
MANLSNTKEIVNRAASSGIITFDIEDYYALGARSIFDIKDFLFQGIVLREKDYREAIKNLDWSQYADHYVSVVCSTDAIVPMWAFMIAASYLQKVAKRVFFGSLAELESHLYAEVLSKIDWEFYRDKKVVIKGCSKFPVPHWAYVEVSVRLAPIAKLIMFGEACSSVPVYKK